MHGCADLHNGPDAGSSGDTAENWGDNAGHRVSGNGGRISVDPSVWYGDSIEVSGVCDVIFKISFCF